MRPYEPPIRDFAPFHPVLTGSGVNRFSGSARDHDLAAGLPFAEIAERIGHLVQLVVPVDGCDFSGLEQVAQRQQIGGRV